MATSARRTVPSISEADWQQQIIDLVTMLGGCYLHVRRSIGKNNKWVTATNVSWPDLTIWFPGSTSGVHLVELKRDGEDLSPDQVTAFATLEAAGTPVHLWRPADLESIVLPALYEWRRT